MTVPNVKSPIQMVVRSRWLSIVAIALFALLLATGGVLTSPYLPDWIAVYSEGMVVPLTHWVGDGFKYFAREASLGFVEVHDLTRAIAAFFNWPIRGATILLANGVVRGSGLNAVQLLPPISWFVLTGLVVILGHAFGGRRLALIVVISCLYLVIFGLWHETMVTLANIIICVVVAVLVGLWLGILSYRRPRWHAAVSAIMNVMQTVPVFAYLLPTLLLFGYGPSAALLATVIYALPPMVHATVLALKSVPTEVVEYGRMAGCTKQQLMWRVQLPAAIPTLSVGINQAIMMSLNMVIIASMIGAGGLGYMVLRALRRLDIGTAFEAGLAIVALAIILDRLSQAAAHRSATGRLFVVGRYSFGRIVLVWLVGGTVLSLVVPALQTFPNDWTLTTGPFWNGLVTYINQNFYNPLEAIRTFSLLKIMIPLKQFLLALPWPVVLTIVGIAGYLLGRAQLAAYSIGLVAFIAVTGFWEPAFISVYLVTLGVVFSLLIGFPIGFVLASRKKLHPSAFFILDTLQTLPTLVYLIPAVMLFRNGDFAALIAIISYAVSPAVRYAIHGMNLVPVQRLEVAAISGCTSWQRFKWVRMPAAFPMLLLGVNQTVMMALSMLVITALVGTQDLGQKVFIALAHVRVGEGIIGGLCVAAIALVADGLIKAWAALAAERVGVNL